MTGRGPRAGGGSRWAQGRVPGAARGDSVRAGLPEEAGGRARRTRTPVESWRRHRSVWAWGGTRLGCCRPFWRAGLRRAAHPPYGGCWPEPRPLPSAAWEFRGPARSARGGRPAARLSGSSPGVPPGPVCKTSRCASRSLRAPQSPESR